MYILKVGGYVYDLKVRLGLVEKPVAPDYWAIKGWENTMMQLDYKADIVLFGDSITYGGQFSKAFNDLRIVNLGYPGDDLSGMLRRVNMIASVNPDKVFIMAGINGLNNMDLETFEIEFFNLVDSIRNVLPDASLFLQSILPINHSKEKDYGYNEKIKSANTIIQTIAIQTHSTYIDLYNLYVKKEEMPIELTYDGLHLKPECYDRWYDAINQYVYAE